MLVKRQQNIYKIAQLVRVTNSEFFHKHNARKKKKHSTAFKFNKIKEISKGYKTTSNTKTNSTNTKNQNQIDT